MHVFLQVKKYIDYSFFFRSLRINAPTINGMQFLCQPPADTSVSLLQTPLYGQTVTELKEAVMEHEDSGQYTCTPLRTTCPLLQWQFVVYLITDQCE